MLRYRAEDDEDDDYYESYFYNEPDEPYEYYEPDDYYESDDYYERDDYYESDDYLPERSRNSDDDVWWVTSRLDPLTNEEHLTHGRSINIVDFLKSRETGAQCSKTERTSTLLSYCIMPCWSKISTSDVLSDTKLLLDRELFSWEADVLSFLQSSNTNTVDANTTDASNEVAERKEDVILLNLVKATEGIVPITFSNIVNIFLKFGTIKSDAIYQNGEKLARTLCQSCGDFAISNIRLTLLKKLFDGGLMLSEAAKGEFITLFSARILGKANETAVKILNLLLEHGCRPEKVLINMKARERRLAWPSMHVRSECTVRIVEILLENGADVHEPPSDDPRRPPSFLSTILKSIQTSTSGCGDTHPSMLELIEKCVAQGVDVNVADGSGRSLLMNLCMRYKNHDLFDVINFLVSSGVDVNAVDNNGENALHYLSRNRPTHRKEVYEVLSFFIELEVDVAVQGDSWRRCKAFKSYLRREVFDPICYYEALKSTNESYYWKNIELLLDAGMLSILNELDLKEVISRVLCEFRTIGSSHLICKGCLVSDFASVSQAEATVSLNNNVHLQKVLKFMERLLKCVSPVSRFVYNCLWHTYFHCFTYGQLRSLDKLLNEMQVDATPFFGVI